MLGTLRTIRGIEVEGKRVLLRIDGNVAVDEEGDPVPGGDQRLEAVLPTITYLRDHGARIVLLTHLGRPRGNVVESLRLDDIARRLGALLQTPIRYVPDLRGAQARAVVEGLRNGEIAILENLRFDPGEEVADQGLASDLAGFGDIFVQDAFGVSHRRHASVALLPEILPSYAGFLIEKEVQVLQGLLGQPARPAVAIIGGAKLETKLQLLKNLLPRVDYLLPGGGIANTFLKLTGVRMKVRLSEEEHKSEAVEFFAAYRGKIVLPTDVRVARAGKTSEALILPVQAVTSADAIYDLGPDTTVAYCRVVSTARTCIWNGPLGKFELPPFAEATIAVARCIHGPETFAVVGGGDTVRALADHGLLGQFDYVSTGGGAMLAFLEGSPMPGIDPLYET